MKMGKRRQCGSAQKQAGSGECAELGREWNGSVSIMAVEAPVLGCGAELLIANTAAPAVCRDLLGSPGLSGGQADSLSLLVGADEAPVVAYIDASSGGRASAKRYNAAGGGWQPLGR